MNRRYRRMHAVRHDLCSLDWSLRAVGDLTDGPSHIARRDIPVRLPGCVHGHLLKAGLIDDPRVPGREEAQFWIGRCDWQFSATFELPASLAEFQQLDLVCHGL